MHCSACVVGQWRPVTGPDNGCEVDPPPEPSRTGWRVRQRLPRGMVCAGGRCQSCPAGLADCDGDNTCETRLDQPSPTVGAAATPAATPNATSPSACRECRVAACNAGFAADCDTNPCQRLRVNVSQPSHCGRCGNVCAAERHRGSSIGLCRVAACAAGRHFDGAFVNGCETSVVGNPAHWARATTAARRASAAGRVRELRRAPSTADRPSCTAINAPTPGTGAYTCAPGVAAVVRRIIDCPAGRGHHLPLPGRLAPSPPTRAYQVVNCAGTSVRNPTLHRRLRARQLRAHLPDQPLRRRPRLRRLHAAQMVFCVRALATAGFGGAWRRDDGPCPIPSRRAARAPRASAPSGCARSPRPRRCTAAPSPSACGDVGGADFRARGLVYTLRPRERSPQRPPTPSSASPRGGAHHLREAVVSWPRADLQPLALTRVPRPGGLRALRRGAELDLHRQQRGGLRQHPGDVAGGDPGRRPGARRALFLHAALGAALGLTLVAGADVFGATLLRRPFGAAAPARGGGRGGGLQRVRRAGGGSTGGGAGAQAALDIFLLDAAHGLIVGSRRGASGPSARWRASRRRARRSSWWRSRSRCRTCVANRATPASSRCPTRSGDFAQACKRYGFAPLLAYQLALNLVSGATRCSSGAGRARAGHDVASVNAAPSPASTRAAQNFAFLPVFQLLCR